MLGCGKFALRGLSQCLAKEFHPLGVHIAHVIIDGVIGATRCVHFLYKFFTYSVIHRSSKETVVESEFCVVVILVL